MYHRTAHSAVYSFKCSQQAILIIVIIIVIIIIIIIIIITSQGKVSFSVYDTRHCYHMDNASLLIMS